MHPHEHTDTHVCKHKQQGGAAEVTQQVEQTREPSFDSGRRELPGESCSLVFTCTVAHTYAVTNTPYKNTCTIVTNLKFCVFFLKKEKNNKTQGSNLYL